MKRIKSVCVYCGTGAQVDESYRAAASSLGALLAQEKIRLVYGGGRMGLMGLVAEACFDTGGEVIGIIPEHVQDKEIRNTRVTEMFVVDSMHNRKRMMVEKSEAFIVLPGGFGTLDETFEILTWKYLGLHDKPIIILNINGFYDPFLTMVDHMVDKGFTPFWHRSLFQVVDNVADAVGMLHAQGEHMRTDTRQM